jgi:hypothetical protein
MLSNTPDDSRVVSVRLPTPLLQRLDRLLDWHTTHRRRPTTRNAANHLRGDLPLASWKV